MPSRSRKRVKPNSPATTTDNNATPDKHALFTRWSREQGVEIHGVEPRQIAGRGLGLVATKRIRNGDRIVFVPGKAMLIPAKTFLRPSNLMSASPQAQLAITALKTFRDADAPQRIWAETWPSCDDLEHGLPMCWPERLCALLPACVQPPLERVRTDWAKDWAAVEEVCRGRGWSEREFRYYWMIVNSRSFHWCESTRRPGVMAMCPYIDYLNHGPSGSTCNVFQSPNGYEVVADRDYASGTELFATYGAHSNDKLLVHYGFILNNIDESNENNKKTDNSPSTSTNPNTDDSLNLDHLILPSLSPSTQTSLRDLGYLGGYFLSPSRAPPTLTSTSNNTTDTTNPHPQGSKPTLCFKTQVAVRAALPNSTNNEWEYFATSGGEDLGIDREKEVEGFVAERLLIFREQGVKVLEQLDSLPDGSRGGKEEGNEGEAKGKGEDEWGFAKEMIRARWRQIIELVDAFVEA